MSIFKTKSSTDTIVKSSTITSSVIMSVPTSICDDNFTSITSIDDNPHTKSIITKTISDDNFSTTAVIDSTKSVTPTTTDNSYYSNNGLKNYSLFSTLLLVVAYWL